MSNDQNVNNLLDLFTNLTDQEKTEFLKKVHSEYAMIKITNPKDICKLMVYENIHGQYIGKKCLFLQTGNEYHI